MTEAELRNAARAAQRPMMLVLARHAESMRNKVKNGNAFLPADESSGLVKGIPDHRIALTDTGLIQSTVTGVPLKNDYGTFDTVYDSGYLRTIQTREGLLQCYSPEELAAVKIRSHHLIHERLSGYAYDMTDDEVRTNFPYFQSHWEQFGPFYATPPGGESQERVCDRVYRFNDILFRQRAGQKVLVVTHGGTIRAFRFCLEKWTADEYNERYLVDPPTNCGITVYRFNPKSGRLELETYNRSYLT